MKHEVQKIVEKFSIKVVKSMEEANEVLSKIDKGYASIVTGKIAKTGEEHYFAIVSNGDKPLSLEDKTTLAALYLETVVFHSAVRDMIIDKLPTQKTSKRRIGTL